MKPLDTADRDDRVRGRESGREETYFLLIYFYPVDAGAMSLYNYSLIPPKMANVVVFIALEETIANA